LLKTSSRLTSGQKIFFAELVGTYVVVLCATGSVVIDARLGGVLGLPFVAFAPFAGIAAMVYAFGKISMAHFNPAVTIGFLASGHIKKSQLPVYFGAEIIGALLASLSVLFFIGSEANLGANAPNYSFPLPLIFGVEVLVTGFLMAVIFGGLYQGVERVERHRDRRHGGARHFLFLLHFWRIDEPGKVACTRAPVRRPRRPLAILVCNLCRLGRRGAGVPEKIQKLGFFFFPLRVFFGGLGQLESAADLDDKRAHEGCHYRDHTEYWQD
jgi:hypothetical protein